jgi:ATP-dependent protease ClpP protease subunit
MYDIDIKGDIISEDSQWIYDWIGLNYTTAKNVVNKLKEANGQPVRLKVNSPGGDVFVASEIYTELRSYSGDVNIEIVGLAASAASVISMAGNSKISPTGQLMVHNVLTSGVTGDYRVMDHMGEVLRNANETIANAYVSKSGMSMEQVLELMNNETWLTAQRAVELGLIDQVMFEDTKPNFKNLKNMQLYNSCTSIPQELLEKIKESQAINKNEVDFFMKQKAQAQLNLLKIGGKIHE